MVIIKIQIINIVSMCAQHHSLLIQLIENVNKIAHNLRIFMPLKILKIDVYNIVHNLYLAKIKLGPALNNAQSHLMVLTYMPIKLQDNVFMIVHIHSFLT